MSGDRGFGGWDGVGLIAEVTLLDCRKPDYCQTYNVTTDSTTQFAMYRAEQKGHILKIKPV